MLISVTKNDAYRWISDGYRFFFNIQYSQYWLEPIATDVEECLYLQFSNTINGRQKGLLEESHKGGLQVWKILQFSYLLDLCKSFIEGDDIGVILFPLGVLQQVIEEEGDTRQSLDRPHHQLVETLSSTFLVGKKYNSLGYSPSYVAEYVNYCTKRNSTSW